MAILNGIGEGALDQALAKRLVTPGGTVAPGVAPELFPVIVLENDRPEYQFLSGYGRYARFVNVTAGGALTRSSVTLFNNANNLLVVVERIEVVVASGSVALGTLLIPTTTIPFGTVNRGTSTDTRAVGAPGSPRNSQALLITDNTLGGAGPTTQYSNPSSASLDRPWILGPGGALYINPNADNVAINSCNIFWRERSLNPGERI